MSDRNQIGYKNPPKHTRFRKGKSGNPKGRPKKSNDHNELIKGIVYKTCIVNVNDKKQKMTYLEVILQKLCMKAIKGDMKAAREFLHLAIGKKKVSKAFSFVEDDSADLIKSI